MIDIVWEYEVKEEVRGLFELAYGPGGTWSKLFSSAPGYRGTTLLRDWENRGKYLCLDLWDSLAQREQWLAEHRSELAELEADFARWTVSQREVGVFTTLAEATVRPRGKTRTGKKRSRRRR
jgi:heme-degrading monooxygenase HmoA